MANHNTQTQSQAGNGGAATATPVQVINVDAMKQFLDRKAAVSAEELGSLKMASPGVRMITVGGDPIKFLDGRGTEHVRPRELRDMNPALVYAWLAPESLQRDPLFATGWYPVKATNPGGKGCPDYHFNQDGFITQGESFYCWTTQEHYNKQRSRDYARANAQMGAVAASTVEGKAGGVKQDISIE